MQQSVCGSRWYLSVPVPIVVTVHVTAREIESGRLNRAGFLRDVERRLRVAQESAIRRWEDSAELEALRARIRVLENERAE